MSKREHIYELLRNENEDNRAAVTYNRVMVGFIILSLVPLCFHKSNLVFDIIEFVCVAVFIVDYLLRWSTADLSLKKGAVSFVIYPFTPMAIIDLLSILPSFIALNSSLKTLRLLRLLRALRAFKLIRYSKGTQALIAAFKRKRQQLLIVLALACAYVAICALVIFNVEPETFPSFFDALYWSVVSLTTVGYGDLFPTSEIGRALAMISSLMGIAIVALPSSIITTGLMEELKTGEE